MSTPPRAAAPALLLHRVPFASGLARFGDRPALLTPDRAVGYAELADLVGTTLAALGTTRRLVLVPARSDVPTVVAYLAALAGGHPVVLVPHDKPDAVTSLAAAYDPDVVVVPGEDDLPRLDVRREGTAHRLHPDLALLLSTSGTTGSPKLVRLSATNLQANAESIVEALGIRSTDVAATTLPLSYSYGLSVLNSHLAVGASLLLTDLSVVDPCFWQAFTARRVTTLPGVPHTFELLDRAGFADRDLPSLRLVTQAGGRLAPERVRQFAELGRRRGWDLVVMYGQTEATARMACLPADLAAQRPQTIGVPIPGGTFHLRPLAPDAGSGAEPGARDQQDPDVGELVYTGPNVMLGYAHGPHDLALGATVTELRTGDVARRHPDGLYEIVGRLSRFAKLFGLRIDLDRVEDLFAGLGVRAACASTDERIVAAVEGSHPDVDLLARTVAADLGLPARSVVARAVRDLPRLGNGKTDYRAVAALAEAPEASVADGTWTTQEVPAEVRGTEDLRRLFGVLLDRDDVRDEDTFVGLGGDSLSYVETSIRLEQVLGHLPEGWHVTPVRDLVPRSARTTAGRRRRRIATVETSVVLRAVAIVLIVATHAKLLALPGGAHVLMAVAGFNFARFQLGGGDVLARLRRHLGSIARVVVPSVAFIAVAALVTDRYTLANVLLLNAIVGPPTWTEQWHFWFIEVLVYVLVAVAALLALPPVARLERRHPLVVPAVLFGVGLLVRYDVVDPGVPHTMPVLWLFALGWFVARSRTTWHRLAASAAAVVTVPGFFGDPQRELLVLGGVLLLAWVPALPVLPGLNRVAGLLAAASLYIYLTHWLVYPALDHLHPAVGVVASLLAGAAYWAVADRPVHRWRAVRARLWLRRGGAGPTSSPHDVR